MVHEINWETTKADMIAISKIAKRQVERFSAVGIASQKQDIEMDITAAHLNGCPLDLDKLLAFDDMNFAHDVCGIMAHIDRETGAIKDFFLPHCAK